MTVKKSAFEAGYRQISVRDMLFLFSPQIKATRSLIPPSCNIANCFYLNQTLHPNPLIKQFHHYSS